jgi:hypothetical protein
MHKDCSFQLQCSLCRSYHLHLLYTRIGIPMASQHVRKKNIQNNAVTYKHAVPCTLFATIQLLLVVLSLHRLMWHKDPHHR